MEFKYTTDGKKVVVVGKLNNQETIVQEIFIVDGNEIPSGENFVVKSLHDGPAVSWKQKEIEKMEATYEVARKNNEVELLRLRNIRDKARVHFEGCAEIIKNTNPEMFEAVSKLIGGEYKFALLSNWGGIKILPIEDFSVDKDGYKFDLRLLTLFGRSNGDFSWNANRYRDASGNWEEFIPCETKEQALQKAVELIESKDYSRNSIAFLLENELPINKEKYNAYLDKEENAIKESIGRSQKEIDKLNISLAALRVKK